ncbi:hypothetical protein CPAR01_07878, partial [Colletotrichum paranaense]
NPPRKSHQRASHPSPSRQDSARNRFTVHIDPRGRGAFARPIIPMDVDVIKVAPSRKSKEPNSSLQSGITNAIARQESGAVPGHTIPVLRGTLTAQSCQWALMLCRLRAVY